jgi:hypothetical protein
MERYFFYTEDGVCLEDDEGTLVESVEDAKDLALRHLVDSLRGNPSLFWHSGSFKVIVHDDAGRTAFILDLSATMSPAPSGLRRFD